MVKRGIVETLLRGLDNTIANWQVVLLRLAEGIALVVMTIAAAIGMILPVIVSLGVRFAEIESREELLDALVTLAERWPLFVWILVALCVLLLFFVIVHSFVVAGCARIAVDADRAAGPANEKQRSRFRVFTMSRWTAGGTEGWRAVFWIYNVAWGIAGLVLLIPLLPTAVLLTLVRNNENPQSAIVIGCSGLALTFLLGVFAGIVTNIWTGRAIVGWAARRESPREALKSAWSAMRLDLKRHVLIALAIFVISGAGSSLFASLSMFSAFGDAMGGSGPIHLVTMPIRMLGWLLSSAFSAAMATWFLSAYSALTTEE